MFGTAGSFEHELRLRTQKIWATLFYTGTAVDPIPKFVSRLSWTRGESPLQIERRTGILLPSPE